MGECLFTRQQLVNPVDTGNFCDTSNRVIYSLPTNLSTIKEETYFVDF